MTQYFFQISESVISVEAQVEEQGKIKLDIFMRKVKAIQK
jgi:hypothetical protein